MIFSLVKIYLIFFAFSYALKYANMPLSFGFTEQSTFIQLIIFFQVIEPLMEFLHFVDVAMVRKMEFAADKYSVEQGYAMDLKDGLIAIHVKNQANLNPDWLYALLKFDHPALVERLAAID